jgi:hypothetical protein|tara:strand:- start:964 stop:1113 length:150 start_codon:yes stop_codon:yes gene_type:complete
MKKRDEVALEIKELHRQYWSAGFTSMTEQQYHEELKRLRFRWIVEYTDR